MEKHQLVFAAAYSLALAGCLDAYMPTNKTTDVSLQGLVKQPNPYGDAPAGSLEVAQNIQIKRKGVIEPRLDLQAAALDHTPLKGWDAGDGWLLLGTDGATDTDTADQLWWYSGLGEGDPVEMSPTRADDDGDPDTTVSFAAGKAGMTFVRDRYILTDAKNPIVIDHAADEIARSAGMPMPHHVSLAATGTDGFLASNMWVGYKALFVKVVDDYVFEGAASAARYFYNAEVTSQGVVAAVAWDPVATPVAAGDKVRLYRTVQVDEFDLIGDRYQLAMEVVLSNSDISAGLIMFEDSCIDDALGGFLYVNSDQQGASANNYMPPPSSAVATHKEVTFYAATKAWQTLTVKAPFFWGELSSADQLDYGFGTRALTGAVTTGVATLSGVVDVSGVVVGQKALGGGVFAVGTTVLSVSGGGPYTITFSTNSLITSGATTVTVTDVLEINGTEYDAETLSDLADELVGDIADGLHSVAILSSIISNSDGDADQRAVILELINPLAGGQPITLRATNGSLWSPPIPDLNDPEPLTSSDDPRTNRLFFSKAQLPEAVALDASLSVGNGQILALIPMQEQLIVAATDGVFAVTGFGKTWSVAPLNDQKLITSEAYTQDDNRIYAWSQDGLVMWAPNGSVQPLSSVFIEDDVKDTYAAIKDAATPFHWGVQVACDRFNHEVWFNANTLEADGWLGTFIWSMSTQTFVQQNRAEALGLFYAESVRSPVLLGDDSAEFYDDDTYMPVDIRFNPNAPADLGNWKQWLDVTLHLEDLGATITFTPEWERVDGAGYSLAATSGSFEHVVVPPQDYVRNKRALFGFSTTAGYFRFMGLSYRYRVASETLRQ